MNNLARQKLCEIVVNYGRAVCHDPQRCEALLRDLCAAHRSEVHVLASALKERVAADLLGSNGSVPKGLLLARLTTRLENNLALSEEAARWGVESWALALGVISPTQLTQPQLSLASLTGGSTASGSPAQIAA